MKKIIALLCSILMLLAAAPALAEAPELHTLCRDPAGYGEG